MVIFDTSGQQSLPPLLSEIPSHLCRVPALPSRRRRHRRRGRRSGRLVKLKFYLSHCSASTGSGHGSFLGSPLPRRFLDPVDACLVPVVGFEALLPRRPCPLRLNMRRQCLQNLRSLCRVSRPVEAHAPAPVRIGLVNARSLVNKTFILRDFFTSHDLDFLSVTETWLSVSAAGGERAFSKMKLIKNYLRSTTSQDRLNGLAMLSIEHEMAQGLDFSELINNFAIKKVRRMAF
ncbi:hypothetical protein MHYP_G00018770 [Metynnis hypsauchen]